MWLCAESHELTRIGHCTGCRGSARVIETRDLQPRLPRGRRRCILLDLSVPQGGVLLVQGASGSGKSTLLGLLAGLLRARRPGSSPWPALN